MTELPPLHVVTDDAVCARPRFVAQAGEVLRAGGRAVALHLRAPAAGGRRLHDLAAALLPLAHAAGARLVVNDRADVALAVGAHGVQLGTRSLLPAEVRRFAPGLAIGASVHAGEAVPPGADWLLAGNLFATASHPERPGQGTALVAALAPHAPVVAIGGITPGRVAEVRRAGASGVAALSGIWDAAHPADAVHAYLHAWHR